MPPTKIRHERTRYLRCLALADTFGGGAAAFLSWLVVYGPENVASLTPQAYTFYPLLVPAWLLSLLIHGRYEVHSRWLGSAGAYRSARAAVIGTLVWIAVVYFLNRGEGLSRAAFIYATLFSSALLFAGRVALMRLAPRTAVCDRYLLLGRPADRAELAETLADGRVSAHVEVVGCLADDRAPAPAEAPSRLSVLGC